MTVETFDRARYGTMSVADLAVAFEQLVGGPPEKKNKLWMLKRMEQAASNRAAVDRAVARAQAAGDGGDAPSSTGESEALSGGAPAAAESGSAPAPQVTELAITEAAGTPAETGEPRPASASAAEDDSDAAAPPAPEPAAVEGAAAPEPWAGGAADATDAPAVSTPAAAANDILVADPPPTAGDGAGGVAHENGVQDGDVPDRADGAALRRYVPARFKAMSMEELHALYLRTVGRPTKSVDRPYLAWKINLTERKGASTSSEPRRVRRTSAGRGESKAVTLREYPDTLAAVEGVCSRHNFRNRLDFFRRAAQHFLQHLGERDAAAFFAEMAPSEGAVASSPSPS